MIDLVEDVEGAIVTAPGSGRGGRGPGPVEERGAAHAEPAEVELVVEDVASHRGGAPGAPPGPQPAGVRRRRAKGPESRDDRPPDPDPFVAPPGMPAEWVEERRGILEQGRSNEFALVHLVGAMVAYDSARGFGPSSEAFPGS